MRHPVAVILLTLCTASAWAVEQPALRAELLDMYTTDQQAREAVTPEDFRKWRETDAANQKRLKQIVTQYGWPTISMVGKDGANAAWIIAQHSDNDHTFQNSVLQLMEPLVRQGEVAARDYAYLYDRTHYPQRYGTQGSCINAHEWQPFTIEDIEHVNQRRKELGLLTMVDYAKGFDCSAPLISFHSDDDPKKTVPAPR